MNDMDYKTDNISFLISHWTGLSLPQEASHLGLRNQSSGEIISVLSGAQSLMSFIHDFF